MVLLSGRPEWWSRPLNILSSRRGCVRHTNALLTMTDLELIKELEWWCSSKIMSYFPDWDRDEIINEGYILCKDGLMDKHDNTRGSFHTFLRSRLWDPIHRNYVRSTGLLLERKRIPGGWGKRQVRRILFNVHPFPDPEAPKQEPVVCEVCWENIPPVQLEILMLLSRGYKKTEIAALRQTSIKAVCLVSHKIKKLLK